MYEVEQGEIPREFEIAWQCARRHIKNMGQDAVQGFFTPSSLSMAEHLSFRLGNQLFFVYVDTDVLPFVGKRKEMFLGECHEAEATPCVLKMEQRTVTFEPSHAGWGFVDPVTGSSINPTDLVSSELIEMSDWEVHEFAIQIVQSHLEKEGKNVFAVQSSRRIDPSIWFKDKNCTAWVIVRADRYPKKNAARPTNIEDIKLSCARVSNVGFFASVTVASFEDSFDPQGKVAAPLYRGNLLLSKFEGLEPL